MVKRKHLKTIFKTLTENISRFLVMCFIVMLGVSFVSGLGTLASSLTDSINDSYQEKKRIRFYNQKQKRNGIHRKRSRRYEKKS